MDKEFAAPMDPAALPEWLRLLPLGRVALVDGREPFEVDGESLAEVVAAFRTRGVDVVIDYEHQSLQGRRAPAAGWIKVLEAREDGLWARVEWTPQAREYLRNREYRYFSPVLRLDPQTRKPEALLQVALTNVPAIQGLPPLVAKCRVGIEEKKERRGMKEALKSRIGLPPGAEEETLLGRVEEWWRQLALTLDLPAEASAPQLLGAVEAMKAGAERVAVLQEELDGLQAQVEAATAGRAVEEAMRAGKISPAQHAWALAYCRRDLEGFQTYVAQAPRTVPVGTELRLRGDEPGEAVLSPPDLEICRQLNLTPTQYRAAKAQIEQDH